MEYHNLITKFFAGEISDREMILLKAWLEQNPENRYIFNEENELWQETSVHTKHENYKTDTAWINISSRLGLGKNNSKSFTILSKNNFRILIAAATVACLLALGGLSLWITGKTAFHQIAVGSTIIETNEGEKAHIFLADSTEIILNSGSTLQYNGHYNIKDRIVKFTGEAFFDVSTNPEKPFVVQLDQMSISATGTRFNVFSFGNEDRIETTLEEGVIQVSIRGKEPIKVKSGQQVVYFVKSRKVLVRDVATDTYTSWKDNKLRFNDTPFEEVLRRIGRKYNVVFEITNRDLLNLKYTATFIDESIEEVMQMLKTVSPITYKIYNRTSVNDKQYLKPKIVVGKRKDIYNPNHENLPPMRHAPNNYLLKEAGKS
jgi:transmembrane sensor